jgi:hypothetical protein
MNESKTCPNCDGYWLHCKRSAKAPAMFWIECQDCGYQGKPQLVPTLAWDDWNFRVSAAKNNI